MSRISVRAALGAAMISSLLSLAPAAQADAIDDGVKLLEAQKYDEARKIFTAEAARDNGDAMYYLGEMRWQGLGEKAQHLGATSWWERGAYLDSIKCQLALAEAYRGGHGVKLDPRQAMIWDRAAARLGSAQAMKNIGDYYAEGNGQEIDRAEAARWYVKAARGGFPGAWRALGLLAASGEGVKRDPAAACVLVARAAQGSGEYAPDRNAAADARVMRHELSADDAARAKGLTAEAALGEIAAQLGE